MGSRLNLGAITAYAIAVKHGFEGTEEEWLNSLKGGITIDDELSDTSTNPLQNKVITKALNEKVDKVKEEVEVEVEEVKNKAEIALNNAVKAEQTAKEYTDEKFNGANKAVSFVNYSSMISSLNILGNNNYNVGQNIMIVTLEVPDLWVSEIAEESIAYTYVSDTDFINELATNGSVQVGHYRLSALETQKVDLADYVKNTDYATLDGKAGLIALSPSVNKGITRANSSPILEISPATEVDMNKKSSQYQPITPKYLDYAVKVGLITNTLELTDEEKVKALAWLGAFAKPNWSGVGLMRYNAITGEVERIGNYQSDPSNNQVPLAKVRGRITTNTPEDPKDCVNKEYFDNAIANVGKLYRYHVKIHILSNGMIPVYVEFDTFSQNADLFSNNNTAIENYNILHSLYASEKIPVVYKCSFDGYNVEGSVSLTFNASSNGMNELMGCGFDIDKITHQYIIDGFYSSEISTFEFTRFEQ